MGWYESAFLVEERKPVDSVRTARPPDRYPVFKMQKVRNVFQRLVATPIAPRLGNNERFGSRLLQDTSNFSAPLAGNNRHQDDAGAERSN